MNDLNFTFEESIWEQTLGQMNRGDTLSAVQFLTMMEQEEEEAVMDALVDLDAMGITLDVSDLPKAGGTGEAALRLRREEELDNIHSIYVDQWDWEKIITRENRNSEYLKLIVRAIVRAICDTNDRLHVRFPQLRVELDREVSFITSQALEDMYPDLKTGSERERAYVKDHHTACIMQIGGKLRSGKPHDGRAPDYDDWQLNCDIFFWDEVLNRPLEISSMGIRVDAQSLDYQLRVSGNDDRRTLPFHQMLLNDELPLTIGGGVGQSRLSMLMMGCAHIGEVQSSVWDKETREACEKAGIRLL